MIVTPAPCAKVTCPAPICWRLITSPAVNTLGGTVTVIAAALDAVTSLFDPCIAQLKAQCSNALSEKTKERDIKNNVARVLGKFKSNKDIDDILKRELCDLFTNSHISKEQFVEAMKV